MGQKKDEGYEATLAGDMLAFGMTIERVSEDGTRERINPLGVVITTRDGLENIPDHLATLTVDGHDVCVRVEGTAAHMSCDETWVHDALERAERRADIAAYLAMVGLMADRPFCEVELATIIMAKRLGYPEPVVGQRTADVIAPALAELADDTPPLAPGDRVLVKGQSNVGDYVGEVKP